LEKRDGLDVLVVGAGPTGMVLASELRRRGVSVRMIDKRPGPGVTSRSFTLHAKTMEMFEHMGCAHVFLRDGIRSRGFRFNFKGKADAPALDFSRLDSPYPYIVIYNQDQTERRLREHLESCYDLRPEWSCELTELTAIDGGFRVVLANAAGATETLDVPWVVGCDGIHSFVRQSAGLDFKGENYDGMVMQMMDVAFDGFEGGDDWVHYFISKESFLLVTRLPSGDHRVLISDMGKADDPSRSQRECFQELIDGHIQGGFLQEPRWATKWTIWKRLANAYGRGNLFLCGDAAHVHSPAGGQGMNAGMQDAFNLGWKLAMVVKGRSGRALLDSYEPERKPIGAQVIAGTDAMHDIIMAHGRGMEDRLRLTQTAGWHDDTVSRIAGLSYHYRQTGSAASEPGLPAGIAPGDRAPDVSLGKSARLFDMLRHPRLTLLVAPGVGTNPGLVERVLERTRREHDGMVASRVIIAQAQDTGATGDGRDVDGAFAARYGECRDGQAYLIRPDGYVSCRCSLGEADRAFAQIRSWS
jgi:2-polyprenyl-6-methoxyphenol hydroxylase-like FAD-dependent oxidoreductase